MTTETTTPTADNSSFVNDIIDSVLVALGMADDALVVGAKHVRYGMIIAAVIGWLAGIWRKGQKPSVGPLGF